MPVEALGFLILGVDQHQPDPDTPGHLDGLEHEVPEEGGAEALSFVLGVNPDPAEQDSGQLLGLVATKLFRADDRRTDAVDEA